MMFNKSVWLGALILCAGNAWADSTFNCAAYPHWDGKHGTPACQNNNPPAVLSNVEQFIQQHAKQSTKPVAVFDWDGTLYNERITIRDQDARGGFKTLQGTSWAAEPLAYMWMAQRNMLPAYQNHPIALVNHLLYTEGKTNVPILDYSKFSQAAKYLVGLSCPDFLNDTQQFLHQYPIQSNAFLPVFDVMQRLHDAGFDNWIVTGSNPYFVAPVLSAIQQKYHYKLGVIPANIDNAQQLCQSIASGTTHIVGNETYLDSNMKFSYVYDDDFVKGRINPQQPPLLNNTRHVVEKKGKELSIEGYIEPKQNSRAVFYAGNSAGDYDAMLYVLKNDKAIGPMSSMVIGVHPYQEGSFAAVQDLINSGHFNHISTINMY